jgi:hypothetical protein
MPNPTTLGQVRVTTTALNVRKTPSLQGVILDVIEQDEIVEWLETSADLRWLKIRKDDLEGWASQRFLEPTEPGDEDEAIDTITNIARTSAAADIQWKDRGAAPRGYIKGMALVFARCYCKLKAGDPAAIAMAQANTGDNNRDALAWYAQKLNNAGLNVEATGAPTLRHLFVLLIGLGMRESSGRYCEGRDRSTSNTTADTAEAGLFQTSFNARTASPLLPKIIQVYNASPDGFLKVFKEGVTSKPKDLENFGSGAGKDFQKLSKESPAFAAEFAAVILRNQRTHWGPINRKEAEIKPACNDMLKMVQNAVDNLDIDSI